MRLISTIFSQIMTFMIVASFSMMFMQLFFIGGILSTKIQRHVTDETDEMKHLGGYMAAGLAGLIAGSISLAAMIIF